MNAPTPMVSIVIPAYNAGQYLPETLDSIFAQTYKDFEVILVDDGSIDNTRQIANRYGKQLRYFYQTNSGGPAGPRNLGIEHAKGKYITFFDSDDIMMPGKLAYTVELAMAQPSIGLVCTDFVKFGERVEYPGRHMENYTHFWQLPKQQLNDTQYRVSSACVFNSLFFGNFIGTSSVLIPAPVFKVVGGFDESISQSEDLDMWFRIARRYDIGYVDVVGHRYRMRSDSISKRVVAAAKARIKVINRHLSHELPLSTRTQAASLIALSLFDIGYWYQQIGDLKQARSYYVQSFLKSPRWAPFRGAVISLLGNQLYSFAKRHR